LKASPQAVSGNQQLSVKVKYFTNSTSISTSSAGVVYEFPYFNQRIRYDTLSSYSAPVNPSIAENNSAESSTQLIYIAAGGGAVIVMLSGIVAYIVVKKRRKTKLDQIAFTSPSSSFKQKHQSTLLNVPHSQQKNSPHKFIYV
jgi:hypothetical protein